MKIVVCIRQGLDGEINPFDACAYEAALSVDGAEITLLSMAPERSGELLLSLTRLGARGAVLLSDKAFAGADTLATAYTLSKAIEKLSPDYVFCGRQTLIGDTAQTPPMLAEMLGFGIITNVMKIKSISDDAIVCDTRLDGIVSLPSKALVTVERINTLRLPKLRSKVSELVIWSAEDIGADVVRCGLLGSPTRVLATYENQSGKRKCKFITKDELDEVVKKAADECYTRSTDTGNGTKEMLRGVVVVGEDALLLARTVSDDITVIGLESVDALVKMIEEKRPSAVLFGSDAVSKRTSAALAARLSLGLCADLTALECDNGELIMYRPALSGSIIAKIKSLTSPALATVRGESRAENKIVIGVGFGVKDKLGDVEMLAKKYGAAVMSSRKLVDNDYMPYEKQVGLTGTSISPPVYIAIGISGAVHHIAGIERSGTVIAINPDKNAPIFEYADYGIVDEF